MAGTRNENILLYADDTAILVSDKHFDVIEARLGTALETISVWLIDNIRIFHGCEMRIEKFVRRFPRDGFFYPHRTTMIDSFSCIPFDL